MKKDALGNNETGQLDAREDARNDARKNVQDDARENARQGSTEENENAKVLVFEEDGNSKELPMTKESAIFLGEELPTKESAILRGGVPRRALDLLLIKIGVKGFYPLGVFILLFYGNSIGETERMFKFISSNERTYE